MGQTSSFTITGANSDVTLFPNGFVETEGGGERYWPGGGIIQSIEVSSTVAATVTVYNFYREEGSHYASPYVAVATSLSSSNTSQGVRTANSNLLVSSPAVVGDTFGSSGGGAPVQLANFVTAANVLERFEGELRCDQGMVIEVATSGTPTVNITITYEPYTSGAGKRTAFERPDGTTAASRL